MLTKADGHAVDTLEPEAQACPAGGLALPPSGDPGRHDPSTDGDDDVTKKPLWMIEVQINSGVGAVISSLVFRSRSDMRAAEAKLVEAFTARAKRENDYPTTLAIKDATGTFHLKTSDIGAIRALNRSRFAEMVRLESEAPARQAQMDGKGE